VLFLKLLLWGIGSCMQWSETEWNTAGYGGNLCFVKFKINWIVLTGFYKICST